MRFFFFTSCWLILFPLGCGMAVLSFTAHYVGMSGGLSRISFDPCPFCLAMVPFSLTGISTYIYLKYKNPYAELEQRRQIMSRTSSLSEDEAVICEALFRYQFQ